MQLLIDIRKEAKGKKDFVTSDKIRNQLAQLGTVSYTHLRAHETVLDLVCRLLLEKKNKRMHCRTITPSH